MNIVVEDVAACRKALRFEVTPEEISVTREEITREFQQFAQVQGFRPGKVPRSVIEKKFSAQIDEEIQKKIVPDCYRKAIEEKKIQAVNITDIDKIEIRPGAPLSFSITVDVAPEFSLPDYKSIRVSREPVEVGDAEVEKTLVTLSEQRATFIEVTDRAVAMDDFAVVNYEGTIDGKPLRETAPNAYLLGENKDFWIRMGEESFVPGFAAQLVGLKTGEKKEIRVRFPADFAQKEVAGQEAVYQVELVGIKSRQLPELNDDFAKEILPGKSLADLKDLIRKDMVKQKEMNAENKVKDELVKQLLESVKFELPETLFEQEKRKAVYDIVNFNQQRGLDGQAIEGKKDEILENATKNAGERLKASFILMKIAEVENIKPTEQEFMSNLQIMAERYGMAVDKLIRKLRDANRLQEVQENLTIGKTLDFLLQSATK
ncbi:MAG: trigger factor [Verrucomicrobiae bacterium]|nr:trigger factor [Verrucomicrobiae bacterium]